MLPGTSELKIIIPLLLRLPKFNPSDSFTVTKCPCGLVFGFINRKHHCRSCGEVFCSDCTPHWTTIPSFLVNYYQRSNWWTPNKQCRVCDPCYKRILKYNLVQNDLEKLRRTSLPLAKLYELAGKGDENLHTVCFYLSEMRRIQYLFPSEELNEAQISFLQVNREILSHHSYWLLQLLKLGPIDHLPDESLDSDEEFTLCTRNCRPRLTLGDAVNMLVFPSNYKDLLEIALGIIKEASPKELEPYSGLLAGTYNHKVLDILFTKATEEICLANTLYWTLNILNTESAISYRETLILRTRHQGIIGLRRLVYAIENWSGELLTLTNELRKVLQENSDIIDPFNPSKKIISIEEISLGKTSSRPIFIKYRTDVSGTLKTLMYKREDTRKDACLVKSVQILADSLKELKSPFPLISYQVIPVTSRSGFVEIVDRSQTLASIANSGSINNYFQKNNSDRLIGEIQSVYRLSLAFWTIITYIFGVGDRHFDNIMVSKDGMLFHIDYGFILGNDSKIYSPKIKLNSYMLEGIGGEEQYPNFKELCSQIFLIIRQNINLIYTLLLNLALTRPEVAGCNLSEEFLRTHLSSVLFLGETDEEAREQLEMIIDGCKDAISASVNDYLHTVAKTTSGVFRNYTT